MPIKDITGQVFTRLTAVSIAGQMKSGSYRWNCVCACGKHVVVDGASLRRGEAKSCGCHITEAIEQGLITGTSGRPCDLTGRKVGLLTVKSFRREGGKRWWTCECECGNTREFVTGHLNDTRVKSAARHCGASIHKTHPLALEKLVMGYYKRNAATRGLAFSLTLEQFSALIHGDCHYCGAKPTGERRFISSRRPTLRFQCNGVDRVQNEIGYIAANSVSCCSLCNHMKGVLSVAAFKAHAAAIVAHASIPQIRRVA